jgi:hypothetical protein
LSGRYGSVIRSARPWSRALKPIRNQSINAMTGDRRNELSHESDNMRKSHDRGQRGISWPVRAILFLLAVLFGVFDHVMSGWAELAVLAGAALLVPVLLLQFRKFWNQRRFWIAVSVLALIQVALVVTIRPLIPQSRSLYTLEFGIVDVTFVIAVILLVCSNSNGENT